MRRRTLALVVAASALAALAPTAAEAKGCHESIGTTVGYARCRRFGSGWSRNFAALAFEGGVSRLHFDPGHIDSLATVKHGDQVAVYHVTSLPDDHRPVIASGFHFHEVIGFGSWLYLGSQFDLAWISSGPALSADIATRGTMVTMASGTHGFVGQGGILFGLQHALGPVVFATEFSPGLRVSTFVTSQLPDPYRAPASADFLLDLHERAYAFVSPHWALGVQLGVDALHRDNWMATVFVGVHAVPFGGTR